ncbi:MAG: hypothetical protein JO033_12675 [Acidobacteriaceae bacterium]|nr:hypothetical protein [Acidobacteriaceae bacterium]
MLTDRTVNTLIVRCDAFKVLNYEREASTLMTCGEAAHELRLPAVRQVVDAGVLPAHSTHPMPIEVLSYEG